MRSKNAGKKPVCVCACVFLVRVRALGLKLGNTPALSQRACSIFSEGFRDRM